MADSSRWERPASQLRPHMLIGPASFYFLKTCLLQFFKGISCKAWHGYCSKSSSQQKLKPQCMVSNLGFPSTAPYTGAWQSPWPAAAGGGGPSRPPHVIVAGSLCFRWCGLRADVLVVMSSRCLHLQLCTAHRVPPSPKLHAPGIPA